MIIYTGTINQFSQDVVRGVIADKIRSEFENKIFSHQSDNEYRSWNNSLMYMNMVLNDRDINPELHVAIEYQIPATSKRVDFIVSGKDADDQSKAVIIELKQWEAAQRTSREDVVTTYVGGNVRAVTHPSYQAYSYAKTIENYNAYVQDKSINLYPCAYLHNYPEELRIELENDLYKDAVSLAPLYLKHDALKLREFIKKHVKKPDNGELLYQIENGKIKPSKALQDALASMMAGNQEFLMIDEQKVVFSTVKRLLESALKDNKKHTIIIEGGPGTGKSVIAMNLLVALRDKTVNYVTKNAAPRNVYYTKLRQARYKDSYIKHLFRSSGSFVDAPNNAFDCLIVDEAHRLNEKSGMYGNQGENQILEIIKASKVSVFFIDEDQIVTTKDFGSVEEIKRCARFLGSQIHHGDDYKLVSQFRCNGSDGYLAFLDDLLGIRQTANYDGFDLDYRIKVFDSPTAMREALRNLNLINNKSRMIAGYCYEWITRNTTDPNVFDIQLEDGFRAKWNFSSTTTWAIDAESFDQVGCIHTAQGLEFDYVGIIIGKDLLYRNGKIETNYNARATTDASLKGIKSTQNFTLADRIIRNTYKTLLSRGQKGVFIYCEDSQLRDYIKQRLSRVTKN